MHDQMNSRQPATAPNGAVDVQIAAADAIQTGGVRRQIFSTTLTDANSGLHVSKQQKACTSC